MKSIKTTIILLAALLSLGSCDFLDKEPTSATWTPISRPKPRLLRF